MTEQAFKLELKDSLFNAPNALYPTHAPIANEMIGTKYEGCVHTATCITGGYCHYFTDGETVSVLYNSGIDHQTHMNHWFKNGASTLLIIELEIVEGRAPVAYSGRYMPKGKPTMEFLIPANMDGEEIEVLGDGVSVRIIEAPKTILVVGDIKTQEEWDLINSIALHEKKEVVFNVSGDCDFPKGVPVKTYTYAYNCK